MSIDPNINFEEGTVLLFDKPLYWTSFDLVKKVKNLIRNKYGYKKLKVGHAGTLDPLASGLLIVCTGKKTKTIESIQGLEKEYIGTIKLGETTPSFDLETEVDNKFTTEHITETGVKSLLDSFLGEQDQVPPLFSAKRIDGKRAYEYARMGVEKKLEPKRIIFHELELLSLDMPYLKIRVNCSKGTYIRSLARDIGVGLDGGAHLTELKRTFIGDYDVENALSPKKFEEILQTM
jgi:tRNA pseudouridine55 synthase